jgi:hypothetical protein
MSKEPIHADEASINTVSVQVKTVVIGNKQLTLSAFKQIHLEELFNKDGILNGKVWGHVNYLCESYEWHILWQKENMLRRSLVSNKEKDYEAEDKRMRLEDSWYEKTEKVAGELFDKKFKPCFSREYSGDYDRRKDFIFYRINVSGAERKIKFLLHRQRMWNAQTCTHYDSPVFETDDRPLSDVPQDIVNRLNTAYAAVLPLSQDYTETRKRLKDIYRQLKESEQLFIAV